MVFLWTKGFNMTRNEIDGQIAWTFALITPGHPVDIFHPSNDVIRVIADDQLFEADLVSDDDGFIYLVPMTDGPMPSNTCIRVPYPA